MEQVILSGENLWRKKKTLKKMKVDNINWLVFYLDEVSKEKWVEEYPYSELQAGGPPQLRLISEFPWEKNEK